MGFGSGCGQGGGFEGAGEVGLELRPGEVGFGHADDVGADGVLTEGDGEAGVGEGPVGGVGDGAADGFVELVTLPEHVFEVGVGLEAGGGEWNEVLLPAGVVPEDVGGGELAAAVEPPEEGGAVGVGVGGSPVEDAVGEGDVDEAVVRGFDGEVGVDDAGGVDEGVEGGVFGCGALLCEEVDGESGGLGLDGVVPCRLSGVRPIDLGPAEAAVAEAGADGVVGEAAGFVEEVCARKDDGAAEVCDLVERVGAGEVFALQALRLVGRGACAVGWADEVDPVEPFALVGLDEGGGFGRELRAEGLVVGSDLGVERGEAGVGADGFFARGLGELAVEALGGGERGEQ